MTWNRLSAVALVLCASLIASCGGGGGGGGSSSGGSSSTSSGGSGSVRFTADKTAISFEFMEGGSAPAQEVVITATGTLPETLYIGAVADGAGIDPNITIFISGTTGTFRIMHASGLAEGTYTGRIQLMGCSDVNCNRQVGNSPLYVTYTTRVQPKLKTTPASVTLDAVSGNSAQAIVDVTLPWQQTTQTASVEFGHEWLSLVAQSPTSWQLVARSMPSGTRNGTVRIQSGPYSLQLPVTYVVTAPPGGEFDLRANPTSLTFAATENTDAPTQSVTVLGPTWAADVGVRHVISYEGYADAWLTVTQNNGAYEVTASARYLREGSYKANLVFEDTDPETVSTNVIIPVTFTVGRGLVQPADIDVTIDSNTTTTSSYLHGTVPIDLVEGPQIQWTATSERSWVKLTRAAGDTGTSLEYEMDLASLDLRYTYDRDDDITIAVYPSNPVMMPVFFKVKLHRRLAHVDFISPNLRVFGRESRHIIRGKNFIANRDWSQHLLVGEQPVGARITRVDDTELIITLPADQSSASIRASNALGEYNTSVVVSLVPTYDLAYEAVPTGYAVRKMIYNPQSLIAWTIEENAGLGQIHYYTPQTITGGWSGYVPKIIPGLKDAVRGIYGGLVLFGTQGIQIGYDYFPWLPPQPMSFPAFGDSGAVTNDGKLWFAVGDSGPRSLAHVQTDDLPFLQGPMAVVDSPLLNTTDPLTFAVSGDRERMYVSQSAGSSQAPLLQLNAVDGQLTVVPNQGSFGRLEWASMSDDASRLIAQDFQVRDAQFNVIGNVVVTQNNYMSIAANVSNDGRRAYVLAYERSELTAPAPQYTPRVYVFNLTSPVGANQQLPLLGYFTLAHYPTCLRPANCSLRPESVLNETGNTLFYAGDQNFIVAPVPAESALMSRAPSPRVQKQSVVTKRMK